MESYTYFAQVYDELMDAPYSEWASYIESIWTDNGLKPDLVLDLACGTGSMTHELAKRSYDMIGIDMSPEMLMMASQKNPGTLFLNQDMREFELYGTVDAVICICDSINYILEHNEVVDVFKLVENYLNPGGIFIFDINTKHKYENILADNSFSFTSENAAYIWENFYDADALLNEYQATFFIKEANGKYVRHEELHAQKAHSDQELKEALKASGLEIVNVFANLKKTAPSADCERVFYVVRKKL